MEELNKQRALQEAERMRDWFRVGQNAVEVIRAAFNAEKELAEHETRKTQLLNDIAALETRKVNIEADINALAGNLSAARAQAAAEKKQIQESLAPLRRQVQEEEGRLETVKAEFQKIREKVA